MIEIKLTPQAAEDYVVLDRSVRLQILKAIEKLRRDPRGYGDPLGNKCGINLWGFYSIRADQKRYRLIYLVQEHGEQTRVVILAIGKRERFQAHLTARDRIRELARLTEEELVHIQDLLKAVGDP